MVSPFGQDGQVDIMVEAPVLAEEEHLITDIILSGRRVVTGRSIFLLVVFTVVFKFPTDNESLTQAPFRDQH